VHKSLEVKEYLVKAKPPTSEPKHLLAQVLAMLSATGPPTSLQAINPDVEITTTTSK